MNEKNDNSAASQRVEAFISYLLRSGVLLSLAIIVLGMLISFLRHPQYLSDPQELERLTSPGAAFPRTVGQVVDGVRRLSGQAIVVVGLLLLVITPVMRVAASIVMFVCEKDGIFVAVTSAVLVLLIVSFLLGGLQ